MDKEIGNCPPSSPCWGHSSTEMNYCIWILAFLWKRGDPKERWPQRAPTMHSAQASAMFLPGQLLGEWSLFSSLGCKLCSSELFSKGIHAQLWIQSSLWSQAEGCLLFDQSHGSVLWGWEALRMLHLSPTVDGLGFAFLKLCNCLNLNSSQGSNQECWQTRCRTQAFVQVLILCQAWFSLELWVKPWKLMYVVLECDPFHQVTPLTSLG